MYKENQLSKRTLVIVTCDRDRWEFDLLCRSIYKFLEPSKIIVICNENDDEYNKWEIWFKQRCSPVLYRHSVKVMKKRDFWQREHESHLQDLQLEGWIDQQVIKLAVAKYVTTPEYICLDSKNFFIRPCSLMDIQQQEPVDSSWMGDFRENWVKLCCNEFGIVYPGMTIKLTVNITPYIVQTKPTRKLVNHYGGAEQFFIWFSTVCIPDTVCASEFQLYELWCIKHSIRPIKSKQYVRSNIQAFWGDIHHEQMKLTVQDYIDTVKQEIDYNNIYLAGLHKTLRPYLTSEDVKEIFRGIGCTKILPPGDMPFTGSKK